MSFSQKQSKYWQIYYDALVSSFCDNWLNLYIMYSFVIDTEDYGVGSEASQKMYECKVKVWDSKKT